MYPNIVATTLLLILPYIHYRYINRNPEDDNSRKFTQYLGKSAVIIWYIGIVMLWIIPFSSILVPVALIALSLLSPYGRMEWKEYRKHRVQIIATGLVIILTAGFIPATVPVEPSEWGQPLPVQSSSDLYPSGSESAWLINSDGIDWSFVVSYKINTPHQFGGLGHSSVTLSLADAFSLEEGKLSSAVDLLDEQLTFFSIDSEDISLVREPGLPTHSYSYEDISGQQDVELNYRIWSLNSLALGTSEQGVTVAEVLLVSVDSWGGSIDMLAVIRPISSDDLAQDRFAEDLVSVWLNELLG